MTPHSAVGEQTSWVTRTFGATVTDAPAAPDAPKTDPDFPAPDGAWSVNDLVILGLRRNPRRAHLLVSTVLGKHIPARPGRIRAAADALGDEVVGALGAEAAASSVVLGFAETATGLGHCVAERLSASVYLHSTRRQAPGVTVSGTFEEGHSHATTHLLQPTGADLLTASSTLVLVDDEISTGATALQAIAALHALAPHTHYVVAALVDMRSAEDEAAGEAVAAAMGVRIDHVSLARGRVSLPAGLVAEVTSLAPAELNPVGAQPGRLLAELRADWPAGIPDGGRHGYLRTDSAAFHRAATTVADAIAAHLVAGEPVTVLAHEEFMYLPLCVAEHLPGDIRYQTTTRSPAHVRDEPGYPLRRGFAFTAPEPDDVPQRFTYNLTPPDDPATHPTRVVLIVDSPADTAALRADGGLLDVLTTAGHDVVLVIVAATPQAELARARQAAPPALRGPEFGSYAPDEVTWLLKDLSEVALEGELAERERRIQAGVAHYAESLPIEYQPGAAYQELFAATLRASARRLATAVGVVTELVLTERHPRPTLVSLARAGTPIGILMRRWARHADGADLPHYTISIVRDRGIDTVALDRIVAAHDPASIVFVDGWTGKGAIQRELRDALGDYESAGGPRLNAELAVLADPGGATTTYGTRDDFLIASACLNSTVSGLVSRTVLNREHILPGDFHGAKFYRHLADHDVSGLLLDTVTAEFDAVATEVARESAALLAADRSPTWSGWASVEQLRDRYGLSSVNFVKPGVGETTRVLLRRVPWRILVREAGHPDHEHIRILAAERGVPVEVVDDLAYSCVGLIKEGQ